MEDTVRPHVQATQTALHHARLMSLCNNAFDCRMDYADLKPQHVSEVHGPFIINQLAVLLTVAKVDRECFCVKCRVFLGMKEQS